MTPHAETLLNLYVDGELPLDRQGELFAHLAECRACRLQFNALMAFRLAATEDVLPVPPSVDAALFQRVSEVRRNRQRRTRAEDRAPFRALARRVPVGMAVAVAALLFVLGLWTAQPAPMQPAPMQPAPTEPLPGVEDAAEPAPPTSEVVYVFYPGRTVEEPAE